YYEFEHGQRLKVPPRPPGRSPTWRKLVETRQPLIVRGREGFRAIGSETIPGTDISNCMVVVPILGRDRILGAILLEDYENENAFDDSDIRLLATVASSMGVA